MFQFQYFQVLQLRLFLELVELGIVLLQQIQQLLVVVLRKVNVLVAIGESILQQLDLCLQIGRLDIILNL